MTVGKPWSFEPRKHNVRLRWVPLRPRHGTVRTGQYPITRNTHATITQDVQRNSVPTCVQLTLDTPPSVQFIGRRSEHGHSRIISDFEQASPCLQHCAEQTRDLHCSDVFHGCLRVSHIPRVISWDTNADSFRIDTCCCTCVGRRVCESGPPQPSPVAALLHCLSGFLESPLSAVPSTGHRSLLDRFAS